MSFKILSVRPVPAGFGENDVALVKFDFTPDAFDSVIHTTRYIKPKNEGEQGSNVPKFSFRFAPGSQVRVHDALIRKNDRGNYYLSISDMDVSAEIRREVCKAALTMFAAQNSGQGNADPFAQPAPTPSKGAQAAVAVGADLEDDIPF